MTDLAFDILLSGGCSSPAEHQQPACRCKLSFTYWHFFTLLIGSFLLDATTLHPLCKWTAGFIALELHHYKVLLQNLAGKLTTKQDEQ